MSRHRRSSRRVRSAFTVFALVYGLGASAFGCGSSTEAKGGPRAVYWAHSPPVCDVDETREYYCDALVPLQVGRAGPPPFDDCPVDIESHESNFERAPPVAVLDPSYTDHMRRRAPPGNVCCFSWCSPVKVVEPNPEVVRKSCMRPLAFRERFCMDELEAGTTVPSSERLAKCPAAIVPPEKAVFSTPEAALFDEQGTSERRGRGFAECCYSWCSVAPPSSGLEGSGPR